MNNTNSIQVKKTAKRAYDSVRGFTLLEIMVVVIIIGILSAMVFPRLSGRREQARRWKSVLQIRGLQEALEDFSYDNGFYPSQEEGLEILLSNKREDGSSVQVRKKGYFDSDDIPLDPWGNNYEYLIPGLEGERYSVISYGKDGKQGGEGWDRDIVSWNLDKEGF